MSFAFSNKADSARWGNKDDTRDGVRSPDDRTLIYMLFDAVTQLSERMYPGEEMRLTPLADCPNSDTEMPTGTNLVVWLKSRLNAET